MTTAARPVATATHCPYCALQCAMTLTPDAQDRLEVTGRDFPTNRGGLCRKGWTAAELLNSAERLHTPLRRRSDGSFTEITWDEALDRTAAAIAGTRRDHGADAVGVFGSGGLTNEKAYQLGKFARVGIGTSRIDYNGRFCMSSAAAAGRRSLGIDRGLPFPVSDLDEADTVLLLGSNVADTMPPFVQHLSGARARGGLIVVDPRRSATANLTRDGQGLHLQPAPGTDMVLLLGLAHVVVHEGLVDEEFVGTRTEGYRALVRSLAAWWPHRVQALTGVPAALLRTTAHRLAQGRAYILTGRGVEQHTDGTDTAAAAINLALLLGLPGSRHGGYGTLTGQGNGQGGREHGQKSDQLPGYRAITDPAARAHVAGVWGVAETSLPGPGLPAVELLASLGRPGGVRCLLVHGSNPAVSAPDVTAVVEGLRRLDFLVVADFVMSETAAEADLVLPVPQWAEEEGTMTTLEGRVVRRRRAGPPPEGVRDELWILAELAARLDSPASFDDDAETVFDELARASAGGPAEYAGIDYRLLEETGGVHWPCPPGSSGTPRLFLESFGHPDGRARFVPVRPAAPLPDTAPDADLTLVTGRLLEHYQSGAQTRRVTELARTRPESRLEIHPATADRLGLADGQWAEVEAAAGTARARVQVSADVRPDTVFLPFHFGGSERANLATRQLTDPVSGMPEFKTTRVRIRPVLEPDRRTGGGEVHAASAPTGRATDRHAEEEVTNA
ncbi:molybdopterin oxidoreductase family protein [Georgenia deserti]|uniref:Molybdopterin oxidoreductase family protein n=1 Tax=Georgenia deserti TaxID=2093781 RepID=A0ABW4LCG1_9MICO